MNADIGTDMNGHCAKSQHAYRAKQRKTFSTTTTVAFSCVAFFVLIIFCAGHSSIIRMHGAMQSPTLERPAGWATFHRTTTVQSATVTISGTAITGSALTATTTETSSTGTAPAAEAVSSTASQHAAVAAAAAAPAGMKASMVHMLGDLQNSFHALLTTHAGWKPGQKITRAQLAAAAAASMPEEGREIELSAQKVAQVVGGAKLRQQVQKLQEQGEAAAMDTAADVTSAEAYASLYGQGGGTVVFAPHDDLDSCPEGLPPPHTAQAAVVLLAGRSAAALKRGLDGMMLLYSRADADVRSAFHLYVGLDSQQPELRQMAADFALASMGAVKLVHHSSSGNPGSQNHEKAGVHAQQQLNQTKAPAAVDAAGAGVHTASTAAVQMPVAKQRRMLGVVAAGNTDSKTTTGSSRQAAVHTGSSSTTSSVNRNSAQQSAKTAPQTQQHTSTVHVAARTDASKQSGFPVAAAAPAPVAVMSPSGSMMPTTDTSSSSKSHPEHIRLMLHVFFNCFKYPAVLLLEDDVKLAPDFFMFYAATQWLLSSDRSLYCLSAWNQLGNKQQYVAPNKILRTDHHPGRGWMLSRDAGLQLLAGWPKEGIQDWQQYISSTAVRAGRQCLVPELPRLVPAGDDETFDYAHVHDPTADSHKKLIAEQESRSYSPEAHIAQEAAMTTGTAGSAAVTSSAGDSDGGFIDMEVYTDYEPYDSFDAAELLDDESNSQTELKQLISGQDGLQQLQQQHLASANVQGAASARVSDSILGGPVAGFARRQSHQQAGWMFQDLSGLMAGNYQAHMQQVLLSAKLCDVTAAATVKDRSRACRVPYNSAAYLATAAHRLNIPVDVQQAVQYCYPLPSKAASAPRQHCQDYMPEMSYHGIVSGYNHHGTRIYLLHAEYNDALEKAAGLNKPAAVATAPAP